MLHFVCIIETCKDDQVSYFLQSKKIMLFKTFQSSKVKNEDMAIWITEGTSILWEFSHCYTLSVYVVF